MRFYRTWTEEETISLSEFLEYAIAQNWVDVSRLDMDTQYADSSEVFDPSGGIYQPGAGKDIFL